MTSLRRRLQAIMHEASDGIRFANPRVVEPFEPAENEPSRSWFIDLSDDRGWAELESALPEGAVDDLTGKAL